MMFQLFKASKLEAYREGSHKSLDKASNRLTGP